ncbi:hypothetical protein F4778DRAFT_538873 [Xylariomycetidae sp. FL2044]|nr:hypothetical protein F4778DRAFT_538873 [Xylariomycetidae sp. FL2044]
MAQYEPSKQNLEPKQPQQGQSCQQAQNPQPAQNCQPCQNRQPCQNPQQPGTNGANPTPPPPASNVDPELIRQILIEELRQVAPHRFPDMNDDGNGNGNGSCSGNGVSNAAPAPPKPAGCAPQPAGCHPPVARCGGAYGGGGGGCCPSSGAAAACPTVVVVPVTIVDGVATTIAPTGTTTTDAVNFPYGCGNGIVDAPVDFPYGCGTGIVDAPVAQPGNNNNTAAGRGVAYRAVTGPAAATAGGGCALPGVPIAGAGCNNNNSNNVPQQPVVYYHIGELQHPAPGAPVPAAPGLGPIASTSAAGGSTSNNNNNNNTTNNGKEKTGGSRFSEQQREHFQNVKKHAEHSMTIIRAQLRQARADRREAREQGRRDRVVWLELDRKRFRRVFQRTRAQIRQMEAYLKL